jgi:hypothetical protein
MDMGLEGNPSQEIEGILPDAAQKGRIIAQKADLTKEIPKSLPHLTKFSYNSRIKRNMGFMPIFFCNEIVF